MNIDDAASLDVKVERDTSRVKGQVTKLSDVAFRNSPVAIDSIGIIEGFNSRGEDGFDVDELRSLGQDIEEKGLLQPIILVVNPENEDYEYLLLAGERRYRAIKDFTCLEQLPDARIYDVAAWDWRYSIMLSENAQRKDIPLFKTVEKVGLALKEYAHFENPEKMFIDSGTLPKNQVYHALAIFKAFQVSEDFKDFVKSSSIQNYRALGEWASAINDEGALSKQKKEQLQSWTKSLKDNELVFKNFAGLAKSVKDYAKGKTPKPKIKTKSDAIEKPSQEVAAEKKESATSSQEDFLVTKKIIDKHIKSCLLFSRKIEVLELEENPEALSDSINELKRLNTTINAALTRQDHE